MEELFHCNKAAKAFTKGSLKFARRGNILLIMESSHNFVPSIDMPQTLFIVGDEYNILTNPRAFPNNKD